MSHGVNRLRSQIDRTFFLDILVLTLVMAVGLCLYGVPVLFTPDEGRYAEIAREMLVNHQYLVPHVDGVTYFEKPPLIYWLTALSLKLFGLNDWAARLVNPLLSTLGILLTYIICRLVLQKRRLALWSALISGTSLLYLGVARYLNLDAGVSFLITATMLSFWASEQYDRRQYQSYLWLVAAFIFSGLSVMTKGLIGIVFPMMIIGLWAMVVGRWRLLIDLRLYFGLVIVALISVPWIIAVNHRYPEFFYYYVIVQQILRYITDEQGRQMSKLIYIGIFIIGFFPWFGFLPQAFKNVLGKWKVRKKYSSEWFLLIWGLAILLFFGFSQSILIGYLMPIIVPFAILIAKYLDGVVERDVLTKAGKASFAVVLWLFIILAIGFIILPFIPRFSVYFDEIAAYYWPAAVVAFVIAMFGFSCLKKQRIRPLMLSFVIAMIILVNLAWSGAQYFSQKTVKPLTAVIEPILKAYPETTVANYGGYFYDAQFYLNRLTWIVANEGELANTAKMANSGANKTLRTAKVFWPIWNSPKRILLLTDKNNYQHYFVSGKEKGILLAKTPKRYLISNQALSYALLAKWHQR